MPTENDFEILAAIYGRTLAEMADRQAAGKGGEDVPTRLLARYSSALYLALEVADDLMGYMAAQGEEAPDGQGEA